MILAKLRLFIRYVVICGRGRYCERNYDPDEKCIHCGRTMWETSVGKYYRRKGDSGEA